MKYLLAFTIPLSVAASFELGGAGSWLALLYAFGFLPLLELFLPVSVRNPGPVPEARLSRSVLHDWLLRVMLPIQLALLARFLILFAGPTAPEPLEALGLVSAMGVACGVLGINVAHELGHRRNPGDRWIARILLSTSLNWQFHVEHNRGHHKNVSTPGDPESARSGESVYRFWVRSIRDSYLSAWRLDRAEMLRGTLFELSLLLSVLVLLGPRSFVAFLGSSLFGILLLQSVNYIEHYGLERRPIPSGGFEPVAPEHSWNSDHFLSRAVLFELSRHSDHHANVARKYPVLRHLDASPQLPTGYPGMILLSLFPPLWFRIMDRLVAR